MTDNASRNRNQDAVYWAVGGLNDLGEPTVSAATAVKVRIEETTEETLDPEGNTIASQFVMNVGQDMPVGGFIWVGLLADYVEPPTTSPLQIIEFEKIPNLRGTKFDRTIKLTRHSKQTPTLTV